jgi:hypothetical protein
MTPPRVVVAGPQQEGFSARAGVAGGQQLDDGGQQDGGERFSIFLKLRIFIVIAGDSCIRKAIILKKAFGR